MFPEVIVEASHPNHATLQSFIIAIYVRIMFRLHRSRISAHLTGSWVSIWCIVKLVGRRQAGPT
jgi:hypothetical protein